MPARNRWRPLILGAPMVWIAVACSGASELFVVPEERADGLVVETVHFEDNADSSPRQITLVRVDPALYRLRLLTSARDGGARSGPQWVEDYDLVGAINASMYRPDGRSTGLMVDGDHVNNGFDNPSYGGYLAFDPVRRDLPAVAAFGRDCEDFDLASIRKNYTTVVQSYRILDCDGRPIAWKDPAAYSSSAVAMDANGWVVFLHSPSAMRMRDLNRWVAHPRLGLTWAMFVEGGTESFLAVRVGERWLGSTRVWGGPLELGGLRRVPNVLGLQKR